MTHICIGKLTIIGSDNGLLPGRRQAIIWTNAGILLRGSLGTNFNEILIGVQTFSFKKMHLKMSSAKWRPFCLGLNVLKSHIWGPYILRSEQNGYCFADHIFKCISLKEEVCILFVIPLKFITRGPNDNISSWIQVTVWHLDTWTNVDEILNLKWLIKAKTEFTPFGILLHQSGTKPNLVAKILATNFGVFCNICNVFKNMFNVGLIIMWQSIVVEGFPTTEIWTLKNLEGYQLW